MAYQIEFTRRAEREFFKLPPDVQKQLAPVLDSLAEDPRQPGVKFFAGTDGIHRIRSGDYRILYRIQDDVLVVLVVRVANRRDAYRRLRDL